MRPWTTRTVHVAAVAAGFAALGAGTANAAPHEPDLSQVPDDIAFQAPVHACQTPHGVEPGRNIIPCADSTLKSSTPNVFKKAGSDISDTAHGLAGELKGPNPLANAQPTRLAGQVLTEKDRLLQVAKERPTLGTDLDPGRTGLVDNPMPGGGVLDATVGPREPGHQGVSGADTAVDLTAAQGHDIPAPITPAGALPNAGKVPALAEAPQGQLADAQRVVPVAGRVPATALMDRELTDPVQSGVGQVRETLPNLPISSTPEGLPVVGQTPQMMGLPALG